MKCVCKTVVWILIIAAIWISNLPNNCFILKHFHQWEIAIAWCICVPIGIFQWRNLFSSHILLYFGDRKEFFLPDRLVYKLEWNVFLLNQYHFGMFTFFGLFLVHSSLDQISIVAIQKTFLKNSMEHCMVMYIIGLILFKIISNNWQWMELEKMWLNHYLIK